MAVAQDEEDGIEEPKSADLFLLGEYAKKIKAAGRVPEEGRQEFYEQVEIFADDENSNLLYVQSALLVAKRLLEISEDLMPWQVKGIIERLSCFAICLESSKTEQMGIDAVNAMNGAYCGADADLKEGIINGLKIAGLGGKRQGASKISQYAIECLVQKLVRSEDKEEAGIAGKALVQLIKENYYALGIILQKLEEEKIGKNNASIIAIFDIAVAGLEAKGKAGGGLLIYETIMKMSKSLLDIDEELHENTDEIVCKKVEIALQIEKNLNKRIREKEGRIQVAIHAAEDLLVKCKTCKVQKIGVNIIGNILYAAKDEKTYYDVLANLQRILADKKSGARKYVVEFFEAKHIAGIEPNMARKYGTDSIIYTMSKDMAQQAKELMKKSKNKGAGAAVLQQQQMN